MSYRKIYKTFPILPDMNIREHRIGIPLGVLEENEMFMYPIDDPARIIYKYSNEWIIYKGRRDQEYLNYCKLCFFYPPKDYSDLYYLLRILKNLPKTYFGLVNGNCISATLFAIARHIGLEINKDIFLYKATIPIYITRGGTHWGEPIPVNFKFINEIQYPTKCQ